MCGFFPRGVSISAKIHQEAEETPGSGPLFGLASRWACSGFSVLSTCWALQAASSSESILLHIGSSIGLQRSSSDVVEEFGGSSDWRGDGPPGKSDNSDLSFCKRPLP